MPISVFRIALIIFSLAITCTQKSIGQTNASYNISGKLKIDESWDPILYVSHIPNFDDMYYMSNEMIIAKTEIDSLGLFQIKLDFLPKIDELYRLHIVKKGNSPASLIIGGEDENHMFLVLNNSSNLELFNNESSPPFKDVVIKNSDKNDFLQRISNMVNKTDSIGSLSSASKRLMLEEQLQTDLLEIADTSNNYLVSLFALHKSKIQLSHLSNLDFFEAFNEKWKSQKNSDYNILKINNRETSTYSNKLIMLIAVLIFVLGFLIGKINFKKNRKIKSLSIQERKIYELLSSGLTNQEIADQLNIGISTVKSHITSIYSKLKVKSRKEIINHAS